MLDEHTLNAADRLMSDPAFVHALQQHVPNMRSGSTQQAQGLTTVSSQCQMLRHSLAHHDDVNAAVSQYFNVALQQYSVVSQITRMLGVTAERDAQFLDFACGYGRLIRFLVPKWPKENVWASEIQSDALDFVADQFGVNTIASTEQPDQFQPEAGFDVIWVASLFSHLPDALFRRWLQQLIATLNNGGVIAFSVHDQALLPADIVMPDSGILFYPSSENPDLDAQNYGTTYVTEAFVESVIRSVCPGCQYYRLARTLAYEQDVYVVSSPGGPDLSVLDDFRLGAWGWVDERCVLADGQLYLRGWAGCIDDGALSEVEIQINDTLHLAKVDQPRADVADFFANPRLLPSGWEFRWPLKTESAYVTVTARSAQDELALLYSGWISANAESSTNDGPFETARDKSSGWRRLLAMLGGAR